MMNEYVRFGQPNKFQVSIRWAKDPEPPARRPSGHGWSMGHIELIVADINLTRSRFKHGQQPHVGWYLAPMFRWLAQNWASLLHEEDFTWPRKDSAPAAIACRRALDFWIGASDQVGRENYRKVQAWYHRHGLRSASAGGLFPDLFIRRFEDGIELSWSGESPPFAPEGLVFESGVGACNLAVEDVAEPLWQILLWARNNPPVIDRLFYGDWEALCREIDTIEHLGAHDFEKEAVTEELLTRVRASFKRINRADLIDEQLRPGRPFIDAFSPAVAMFGGVSPQLGNQDVDALRDLLVSVQGGRESQRLADLVLDRGSSPIGGVPYQEGYQFAEEFLEDIVISRFTMEGFVNVHEICAFLDIRVAEQSLKTDGIRGVALAGKGVYPLIVVNLTSVFNRSDEGKRFTIAHELCHILFDRTRARRVAHTSGPWAAPGIEKRANAFAAYLLMPIGLVRKHLALRDQITMTSICQLSVCLKVSETALIEHLYNFDFIDEVEREKLRASWPRD